MPYQSLQNLLRPTTPPGQEILLENFYSRFDIIGGGANKKIANVEPLYYQGVIAATEFLTYAATKMYIYYEMEFSGGAIVDLGGDPYIKLYNESNVVSFTFTNNREVFDDPTYTIQHDYFVCQNGMFSRFIASVHAQMKFSGYRITLI